MDDRSHDVRLAVLEEQGRWTAGKLEKMDKKLDVISESHADLKGSTRGTAITVSIVVSSVIAILAAIIATAHGSHP